MNSRDIVVTTICLIGQFILWVSYRTGYNYYTLWHLIPGIAVLNSVIALLGVYILAGGFRQRSIQDL